MLFLRRNGNRWAGRPAVLGTAESGDPRRTWWVQPALRAGWGGLLFAEFFELLGDFEEAGVDLAEGSAAGGAVEYDRGEDGEAGNSDGHCDAERDHLKQDLGFELGCLELIGREVAN